ncbi:MAG TPA: sigma-70 family RNA polymerase sigma factor [Isosphaeraceae bacterium]|nr:sigma-70 family RNA polymerase sigma factor [Isosphaeraceae bacterium]
MASTFAKRLIRHEGVSRTEELSDESLLEQFLSGDGIDSQEAFRALVVRHGPMVLGICRHVLNQDHDAEDAFQATFLVLARKGSSIRNRRVLSGWLHEVAYRIAIKARASAVRRRSLEREGMAMLPPAIEPNHQDQQAAWNELRPVLHEEVNRLPDKYRIPVILSYLEGKTNEEVADLLQWPVGTVKGRLSRARNLLRSRLLRRGLALSAAFLTTALSQGRVFAEVVPADLIRRTVGLVLKLGTPAAPPDPLDPPSAPDPKPVDFDPEHAAAAPQLASQASGPATPDWGSSRLARIGLISTLVLVITASLGYATCKTVLNDGNALSNLRTVVSALLPCRSTSGGSCH